LFFDKGNPSGLMFLRDVGVGSEVGEISGGFDGFDDVGEKTECRFLRSHLCEHDFACDSRHREVEDWEETVDAEVLKLREVGEGNGTVVGREGEVEVTKRVLRCG